MPYLLEDKVFLNDVKNTPKLFTGFSDTTVNHLMFYKLGMTSYYGPNFLNDLAELDHEMLPYSKEAFKSYLSNPSQQIFQPVIFGMKKGPIFQNKLSTLHVFIILNKMAMKP